MNNQELNKLMEQVTDQLNETGCEYFLSVMTTDDEAVLGNAIINMNDVDAAAKLISESIKQGGAYGQRMFALFGKVMGSLPYELVDLRGLSAVELMERYREEQRESFVESSRPFRR